MESVVHVIGAIGSKYNKFRPSDYFRKIVIYEHLRKNNDYTIANVIVFFLSLPMLLLIKKIMTYEDNCSLIGPLSLRAVEKCYDHGGMSVGIKKKIYQCISFI